MEIVTNPFFLDIPINNPPITSITLASNVDWLTIPSDPFIGPDATVTLDARSDVAALKVFATGSGVGVPSMRSLLATHIPNIEISQVNGLQAAINSLVKTIVSANATALAITNNGVGDYTVTPNFGTIANKFAQGNDSRFPSNVTGLRKGAGVGSLDTAAVARVDYWDTTNFVASGASHAKGLVPDPGASAGTTRFLREDATWVAPAGTGTVTNIATTGPITGGPITTTGTIALNVGVDHAFTAAQSVTLSDAATVSITDLFTLTHNSSGTAGTGFGSGIAFNLESSTTNSQPAGRISVAWSNAVHASRTSYMDFGSVSAGSLVTKLRSFGSGGLWVGGGALTDPGAGVCAAGAFKIHTSPPPTGSLLKVDATGTFVAAVANTDYAPATPFVGKGPSATAGIVPSPGPGSAPYVRWLRDDGTWQPFVPDTATLINTMLATMPTKTLKANATGGTASPTDVDAKTARSSALLNLEGITTFGDTNYTCLPTDRYVATSATFTADRTVTLPLANSFNPSQEITISDDFGAITSFKMIVARQGSDVIEGRSASMNFPEKYSSVTYSSNGLNAWKVIRRVPSITLTVINSNLTYTPPTGVKELIVHCWGGGGGGGGAKASVSNVALGGGGGGGAYAVYIFPAPGASYSVTVGAGGAGGSNVGGTGSNGGDTDFGGNTAIGGTGGSGDGTGGNTLAVGPLGGIGGDSGGAVRQSGESGGAGLRLSGTVGISGRGGSGASGSGGGRELTAQGTGNNVSASFGGGGGGGAMSSSASGFAGGAGSQGSVAVYEVY